MGEILSSISLRGVWGDPATNELLINDIAEDNLGNLYVTGSTGPVVYKIDRPISMVYCVCAADLFTKILIASHVEHRVAESRVGRGCRQKDCCQKDRRDTHAISIAICMHDLAES